MEYSNAQILSTVLARWLQPMAGELLRSRVSSLPWLKTIESKMQASGWVSRSWSLGSELSNLLGPTSESILKPLIRGYLSKMPDDSLPELAHAITDNALRQGNLQLLDGLVTFELKDIRELKRLLDLNMPNKQKNDYTIIDNYGKSREEEH